MNNLLRQKSEAALAQDLAAAEAGPAGQMLRGLAREYGPDGRFVADLDTRLQALVTRQAASAATQRGAWLAQRHWRLAFAGLALVLALALAGVFAVARPHAASAAEILARATTAGGWRTLHVTWTARAQYGPNQDTDAQNEGWFQAPNRFHLEDNMRTTAGERFRITVVSDGTREWMYDGQNGLVIMQDPQPMLLYMFQLADLETITQEQSRAGYDLQRLNDETVAGRPTYVLDLVARPDVQVKWPHQRLWIDRQYYLTLRHEAWDAGGMLVASNAYTSVEFDQPVPDGLFVYTPPANTPMLDMRSAPLGSTEEADSWKAVARQADFPVFAPTQNGNFGTAYRPYYDPSRRVVTTAYGAPGAVTMYIEQGPANALHLAGQGEAITAGSLSGQYLTEGQWGTLSIERDGIRILFHAFRNAADMRSGLRQVAQSLEAVAPD